jgi:Mrp family chromosome partitioning ATPase
LLVTSSLPSEGKTTTATNTAISLAQTGARVLIIDADMRRPRVHSVFGIKNGEGLSSVLSSEMSESEILETINFDEVEGQTWTRAVALDVAFQTPVALTHDVPSLDAMGLAAAPVVTD